MTHEVKILPMYFKAVLSGNKTFEVRKNDRGYRPGDTIVLKEWDGKHFTGAEVPKLICYMLTDTIDGIEDDYCVLGICDTINAVPGAECEQMKREVDAVPVVHGRWYKVPGDYVCGDYHYKCSACHEDYWESASWPIRSEFCPNCGAKMDEEGDE